MMRSLTMNVTCRLLIVALLSLSFQTARAGMIGTEQAAAGMQTDRVAVLALLERADTVNQLQAQGLDPSFARARVASMSDAEVQTLAGSINSAPAGADSGWATAVVLGILIWFIWFRK